MLSTDGERYPIEPGVLPLVKALACMRVIQPCWSCEGHPQQVGPHSLPEVWFYAGSARYVELLQSYVSELLLSRQIASAWQVTVCPYQQGDVGTMFVLRPEGTAHASLATLHADAATIGDKLQQHLRESARERLQSLSAHCARINLELRAIAGSVVADEPDPLPAHDSLVLLEEYARQVGVELHDTVGQHLAACVLMWHQLEESAFRHISPTVASRFSRRLREAGSAVRALTDRELLSLDQTDEQDVQSVLERVVKASEEIWQVKCDVHVEEGLHPGAGIALQLARIASEAITNAAKHSSARCVTLRVSREANAFIEMRIAHSTVGAPVHVGGDVGHGTAIMTHRIERIGGTIETSRANDSFQILCRVPIPQANELAAG